MIIYNPENRYIKLFNDRIAYVVAVNAEGYLETAYFGKKLDDLDDFDDARRGGILSYSTYRTAEKAETDLKAKTTGRLELSAHGGIDKRYSSVVLRRDGRGYGSDFRYVGHKIYDGVEKIAAPCAHGGNCSTVEIECKDTTSDVFVTVIYTIFDDKDIVVKRLKIENRGTETVKVLRAMSMQLDFTDMDWELVHFYGRWARERDKDVQALHDGTVEVGSNLGRSSHQENPFFYLKRPNADNFGGEVVGFNLIYSGNFKIRVDCDIFHNARVTYGLSDEDFEWTLNKGETFDTPQAVISYSALGVDAMAHNFHAFIRENLITYARDRAYRPVLFNSWEGCVFDFDTQSILSYIDDAAKIGTELFVLDDGWFSTRNDDAHGLGDWTVNRDKIDLHKVMAHCKKKGMQFGIWFEPEMVNIDTKLLAAHPEYALGYGQANELSLERHQLHLDFSNPAVIDNLFGQMQAFLDEYPVNYIKWDYNRIVGEHYAAHLGDRQGEVYHRLVLGYYDLLGRLTKAYPDIMVEGCASGGGRFDLGTLYYCPQIWTSDESDPTQRMFIQYNTSLGYPLSTVAAHVCNNDMTDYRTKANLSLFGTYGYEMNPNRLTEQEMRDLKEVADVYKKYHLDTVQNGTVYHLSDPETGLMSMLSVSQDQSKALFIMMNSDKSLPRYRFVRLNGLDPRKKYLSDYDGKIHSGEYYMTVGLNFSEEWLHEYSCQLVVLEQVG